MTPFKVLSMLHIDLINIGRIIMHINKNLMIVIIVGSLLGVMSCGKPHDGTDGLNGLSGKDGAKGRDGQDGIDGTQVTVVQLCPNQPHPSYPSHFPELALCINSKLYGVYNSTIDYLSELPPGDYRSIAPDGCNLLIKDNCIVEQR